MTRLKRAPKFKNEADEAAFWNRVDSTDYVDWSKAEHWSFPNLKLTSRPITLRLYVSVINKLKEKARELDMPYQTLIKQYIFKGLGMPSA
ncbi:MAG: BrnA antitoxin family protein [Candidatus Gottesmanbacteria bacterium]|nr:BrnA antitoxin family protein [Candidatus Gottesmanbacteria bacterium]